MIWSISLALTCCDVYKPSQVYMYFSKGIKKFNFRFKTIFTNCIFITITINFSYFLRVFEIVNLYLNLKSVFKSIRGCGGGGGAILFLPCLKFLNIAGFSLEKFLATTIHTLLKTVLVIRRVAIFTFAVQWLSSKIISDIQFF